MISGFLAIKRRKMKSIYVGFAISVGLIGLLHIPYLIDQLASPESKFASLVADPIPEGIGEIEGEWDTYSMDSSFYFSMTIDDDTFLELKEIKEFLTYSSVPPAELYFPESWQSEIRKASYDAFVFYDESYTQHLMIRPRGSERCFYLVSTI